MESEDTSTPPEDDFANLLARVRQGDDLAVNELVRRYERTILRSVRARLGKNMRSALDSMDIVQSVHRSLLIGVRNEKYEFSKPEQLIALAVVMVQRKIARHWRKIGKLPTNRLELAPDECDAPIDRIASHDPTVSRVASAEELLNQFLALLDPFDQQLVSLRLSGHGSVDTAKILQREPAFIRMRWTRLRQTLRAFGYSEVQP